MRSAFLIFFLVFAVLPVTANAAISEPAFVETADFLDRHIEQTDEVALQNTLYIGGPELYPPEAVERPVSYTGLAPPLWWRPPMRTAA